MTRARSLLLLFVAACGFRVAGSSEVPAVCGDGVVDPGEACDGGDTVTDAICDATCAFTCGNGDLELSLGEVCDTGISTGAGACPVACEDSNACTTDVLEGSACTATCLNEVITGVVDGDGCCPAGANANTDADCTAMCGNSAVEAGELCDTGITTVAGACPTTCDDVQACTLDTLAGAGTCQAACVFTPITTMINSDGCCPAGANSTNDDDCSPSCGNGVVESGELCDITITVGSPGACPTTCSDGMACTADTLLSAGTCDATCTFAPITSAIDSDGCCPTGANANTDNDCAPVCGNSVPEGTEECDDGNTNNLDGCRNNCTLPASAFRFSDLDLRDPHLLVRDPLTAGFPCRDATDQAVAGYAYNPTVNTLVSDDLSPMDGVLDLSPTLVFRPLSQGNGTTTALELHFASCTQGSPIACTVGATSPVMMMATSQNSGTCLAPLANTTSGYTPAVISSAGKCFVSTTTTLTLNLGGVTWTLDNAQIAAVYSGTPATSVVNGLIRGFLTEATANGTNVPNGIPVIGGYKLSALLPGGDPPGNEINCSPTDDRDTEGGVSGWWVYFNFTAPRATWTDP